ncbi:protein neprosin-like isoform X2 [Cornus florida]|uniref:protein neprosin-like isoform X2 n=1 Tax=Cornus florida TaxID=4283 RepID=UPI00289684AA|nr:protein neprosin-like isoform X2 [Cornus florida]
MAAHFSSGNRREVVMGLKILCCLFAFLVPLCNGGRVSTSFQNLEVQKHLKRLNKPPLKSIKSPDGDVIDCVHISHQPAFEHPLLGNHTVQMRPNYHPEGLFDESKVSTPSESSGGTSPITQLWHVNGRCPEGTIPIRRTSSKDLLRASSIQNYGKKNHKTFPQPKSADPDLINQGGHQIWILGGTFAEDLNSIEAGWQVSPDLYGDNNTRLFTYWTSDSYQATGCYNLLCSGFIQINNEIAMGASIYPLSGYHKSQYDISILVWKDPKEGNWWMQFGNNQVLGYWPAFLFSYLTDSASMIEWGGEVVNSESDGQHTTTQMGSGHFPEEGFGKSSYFRNIQIVDGSNNLRAPKDVNTFTEQSNCYDVQLGKNGDWGNFFYFGGPGRNPNCP